VLKQDGEDESDRSREKRRILHTVNDDRSILHTAKRRLGHVLGKNCLLQHVIKGKTEGHEFREDEGDDVNGYWMTLRNREDIGN
jgi:enterochelin esterase-like enzyme